MTLASFFKKLPAVLAVAAAISVPAVAGAADFFVVTPVKVRTGPPLEIAVTLNAALLPPGEQGVPYAYDFNQVLTVTGDANYDPSSVTWTIASGGLPTGLAISSQGLISGTPTVPNTYPFTMAAAYKTKSAQQDYALTVYPPTQLTMGAPANFGTVTLDATATQTITLSNPGGTPLTQVSLSQLPTVPGLSVTSNTCGTPASPVSLAPNTTCKVGLSWTPADAGSLTGTALVFNSSKNTVTAALSGVAEPASNQITALLRYDSTPFTDEKGNAITTVGTGATLSADAKVGTGSASFAGNGGEKLPLAVTNFGSQDFTLEAYVKLTTLGGVFVSRDNNTNVNWGNLYWSNTINGGMTAWCNPDANSNTGRITLTTSSGLTAGNWHHVAWTRKGTNWSLFLDGKKVGAATGGCTFRNTDVTRIAHTLTSSAAAGFINGLMDHVRITMGRSIYNADFTPAAQ